MTREQNRISVIIPTHGGAENICRAVDSVLAQTYPDFEILVVDDNGRGTEPQRETERRLSRYSGEKRLRYIVHEQNRNGSAARNTGVRASTGSCIALLDDDDEYTADRLEKQIGILSKCDERYGACYCSYDKYRADGRFFLSVKANVSGDILYPVLMHHPSLTSGSLMVRREVWDALGGFDEELNRHQDWEFTARLAQRYHIAAMREVGLVKHLEFRNKPKNIEQMKEYRRIYLEKTDCLMNGLSARKKKLVLAQNRYSIAIEVYKKDGFRAFWRECRSIHMGGYSVLFFARRAYHLLTQRMQRMMRGEK